jgi:hypothetical protein
MGHPDVILHVAECLTFLCSALARLSKGEPITEDPPRGLGTGFLDDLIVMRQEDWTRAKEEAENAKTVDLDHLPEHFVIT